MPGVTNSTATLVRHLNAPRDVRTEGNQQRTLAVSVSHHAYSKEFN